MTKGGDKVTNYDRQKVDEIPAPTSMHPNQRLDIFSDGSVDWVGNETGPLTLHKKDNQVLVLKEAGHTWYWNQYNGQKYEPAKLIVFTWAPDHSKVERLTEIYLKAEHN